MSFKKTVDREHRWKFKNGKREANRQLANFNQ